MVKFSVNYFKKFKSIIVFLVLTRIILTLIGIASRTYITPLILDNLGLQSTDLLKYSNISWLNIWGAWDTRWYLDIAQNGYPLSNVANYKVGNAYAFFPIYPLSMRLFGYITGNYFVSGLLISNIALLISIVFFFELIKLNSNEKTAVRSIKYLILFPTAFLLSGVLSESLFLMFLLSTFYFAKKNNWLLVGILGFFLSLTRSLGVVVLIPLIYMYLKNIKFNYKNVKSDSVLLLLIPLGTIFFSLYNYYLTGDLLAFLHTQAGWGRSLTNPLELIIESLFSSNLFASGFMMYILLSIMLLSVFYEKIGFEYWIMSMLFITIPLIYTSSWIDILSMPRYITIVFPMYIILAKLGENKVVDNVLTISLILIQASFMALWSGMFMIV